MYTIELVRPRLEQHWLGTPPPGPSPPGDQDHVLRSKGAGLLYQCNGQFRAGDKQSDSIGPAELSKRIDPHMIIENGLSSSSNMSTGSKLYRYRLQSSSEISKGTPS